MSIHRFFHNAAIIAALLLTLPAHADADAAADAATPLAAVEVQGHYDNSVGTSDAASQGTVLGRLLEDIALLRPGEALETIPGLVVTQHSGEGKANQYFLRGYNLDHGTDFAVSVDGVPVNMPTNGHGQGYSDINFLIPELIARIDYRKGPYFARNGDFAAAGSADIYYRDSLPRPLLDLSVGEDGYRRALAAASFGGDSGPRALFAIEAMHDDGPWRLPEGMSKLNGLARVSGGDAQQGWSLAAQAYAAHWRSTDQVPLELIESGALCRYCALDPSDGGRSARQILSGEWHQRDADGHIQASAYAEHYRLRLWSNFSFFESDPLHGDQFSQSDARNIFGGAFERGWNHTVYGHESSSAVGAQLRQDRVHVSLLSTEARTPFATLGEDLVSATQGAVYFENTTTWTPWLRSVAGLRADGVRYAATSRLLPANSGHRSDQRISPKLSLIFGPWRDTEFFVNVGNGVHSNDARGVVHRFDAATGEPRERAPALVGSYGKEIGLRTQIVPGLQSSLSVWSLDSASELLYTADSAGTEPKGASRRYGVEWNNHYALAEWLFIDADFARTHARYADKDANGEAGNHIPNAVDGVASLGVGARSGAWSGDLKWRYIGSYPLNQRGSLRAPAAVTANLRVQRELGAHAQLSLDVFNLFDRKFYDIAYAQSYRIAADAADVGEGITLHPGGPRSVRLNLRWNF